MPVPGFSSALAYYDTVRAARLPAALIQGLRDNFGAHNYESTDRDGSYHKLWSADRTEIDVDAVCAAVVRDSGYPDAAAWADEYVRSRNSDADAVAAFGPRDGRT